MTQRNLNEELLNELQNEYPVIEGYAFFKEDPLGNLLYTNVPTETVAGGTHYKVLIEGNPDNVTDLDFRHNDENGNKVPGLSLEALFDIAVHRTLELNNNIPHWHNNLVVDGLLIASNALNKRHADRQEAGVAGVEKELPRKAQGEFHPVVSRLLTNNDKFMFISKLIGALAESFEEIRDETVQSDFVEMTPEGPKRKIDTTPEEAEAITVAVASSQKVLAVLENSALFQTIFATMAHAKKLEVSQNSDSSPQTKTNDEVSAESTQQETSEN